MQVLLNSSQLHLIINRLAQELIEQDDDVSNTIFIGLQPRGVYVSDLVVEQIRKLCPGDTIKYGMLDITFYRDDVRTEMHVPNKTDIPFSVDGKKVQYFSMPKSSNARLKTSVLSSRSVLPDSINPRCSMVSNKKTAFFSASINNLILSFMNLLLNRLQQNE